MWTIPSSKCAFSNYIFIFIYSFHVHTLDVVSQINPFHLSFPESSHLSFEIKHDIDITHFPSQSLYIWAFILCLVCVCAHTLDMLTQFSHLHIYFLESAHLNVEFIFYMCTPKMCWLKLVNYIYPSHILHIWGLKLNIFLPCVHSICVLSN